MSLEIAEYDDAGTLLTTYVESASSHGSRIDSIHPPVPRRYWKSALDVFLPAGYPHSVTEDYLEYQIYDSLQAFASSIAGLLSSRAVLEGVGVGDPHASPTAALLLSVLQDSMGRLATIVFAHRLGTSLEPECKMYRLLADIFNDAAMVLDCLSPAFPKPVRVLVLGGSSVLRALCGVAAGSSKASLSAHFAQWGNLGELGAKDSSQETVISLLGMLAGSLVVSSISSPSATWTTLVLLLAVHLGMNHRAVRAVCMRSLNRQRACLVFSHLFDKQAVLSPQEVARAEVVFERDGVLRWGGHVVGYAQIGVTLSTLLQRLGERQEETGAVKTGDGVLGELVELFREEGYLLWWDAEAGEAVLVLKQGCTPRKQLRGWAHALLVARGKPKKGEVVDALRMTLQTVRMTLGEGMEGLVEKGWDVDAAALETRPGRRVKIV